MENSFLWRCSSQSSRLRLFRLLSTVECFNPITLCLLFDIWSEYRYDLLSHEVENRIDGEKKKRWWVEESSVERSSTAEIHLLYDLYHTIAICETLWQMVFGTSMSLSTCSRLHHMSELLYRTIGMNVTSTFSV